MKLPNPFKPRPANAPVCIFQCLRGRWGLEVLHFYKKDRTPWLHRCKQVIENGRVTCYAFPIGHMEVYVAVPRW